ncbi:MAG: DUF4974 domain-containing protein [Dysgonamonadaceae bacterium]|jgi:ferric-dicitrate binding protein FerR (iron transport regulator)|nr:DUF4974 domain-containing protein [Dysgonamonadaceae bacterium]
MKSELNILLEKFLRKEASAEDTAHLREVFFQAGSKEAVFDLYKEKWEEGISSSVDTKIQKRIWMRLEKQINVDTLISVKFSIWKKYSRIAAAVLLPLLFAGLGYYYSENKFYQSQNETIVHVDKGQKAGLQLPDGTQIWLNSGSSITYNKTYNRKDRVVYLQGEAYFEVYVNKEKPFTVKADGISVEAIGTRFNVKAYPEDDCITTTLLDGCVRVSNHSLSDLLKPNERLAFSRNTGRFTKSVLPDAERSMFWRNNQLAFEQERLEDIAKVLEHMYNVHVKFASENLKDIHFSGKINNNNIESILQLIAFVSPVCCTMENDSTVVITASSPSHK